MNKLMYFFVCIFAFKINLFFCNDSNITFSHSIAVIIELVKLYDNEYNIEITSDICDLLSGI